MSITTVAVIGGIARMRGFVRMVLPAAALVACGKAGDSKATPRDAVIAAWKSEQLAPPSWAPAEVAFARDCQGGAVSGVDVLVCNFASPAEAKAAEDPALAWVGSATGAAQAHGAALIVVADRKKSDPSGRTINKLMKLAPN